MKNGEEIEEQHEADIIQKFDQKRRVQKYKCPDENPATVSGKFCVCSALMLNREDCSEAKSEHL